MSETVRMLRQNISRTLSETILPAGLLALLTGMFWVGSHGMYPKLYQYLVALPTLLLVVLQPRCLSSLVDTVAGRAVLVFFVFVLLSIGWAHPESAPSSLAMRPLMLLLVFLAAIQVAECSRSRFDQVLKAAQFLAAVFAIYTLGRFFFEHAGPGERLSGFGALYNPLLVSHVFGFFAAFSLGRYFESRRMLAPAPLAIVAVLLALLVATGSRTPLVAIAVTLCWLAALTHDRKAAIVLLISGATGLVTLLLAPEIFTQRGLSYRPQIWAEAIRQIGESPWVGHGFNTPMRIPVNGIDISFWEPHNLTLSVMYDLGVTGAVLWLGLYAIVLRDAWLNRSRPLVLALSATVVYGFFSGMTEGGAFLSRPKEHWFVVWIPIALLLAALRQGGANESAENAR